jgi:nucleoid-associated protein YgaU
MQRFVRGMAALVVLSALLFGAPLALLAWIGNPWPPGGWAEVQLLSNRTLYGGVAVIGWLAWAQMTGCVLVEVGAAITAIRERGLLDVVTRGTGADRVRFATGGQQHLARILVTSVAALGIGAGTVASASVATPVHADAGVLQHAAPGEADRRVTDRAEAERGPTITTTSHTTVWRLAETHLGDGARWRRLLEVNRGTTMADGTALTDATQTIPAGTTFRLPAGATAESRTGGTRQAGPAEQKPTQTAYTVKPGDNLWDISEEAYGDPTRYGEIFRASQGIAQPGGGVLIDPDHIEVGWQLTIPGGVGGAVGRAASDTHRTGDDDTQTHMPTERQQQPRQEQPGRPEARGAPETQPNTPAGVATETASVSETTTSVEDGTEEAGDHEHSDGDSAVDSVLSAPWVLAGLTGGGVLLAGSLFLGLQQRRRAQFRARRPGRGIATPDPELIPAERTLIAVGGKTAATVEFMDAALKRVAAAAHAAGTSMPALAAVELNGNRLTLHLSQAADLPAPWQGTPDRAHWHCTTDVDPAELGPDPGYVEAPYPLLVTIGEGDDGSLWLLNCEELGTISVIGDDDRSRDFARHLAAQLAVNPWSNAAEVDCIGIAAEAVDLAERIRYHAPGEQGSAATDEVTADAVAMVDRAAGHDTDVSTGRTGQIDDDAWPSRMLLVDAATEPPPGLQGLIDLVAGQRGRTATSILIAGTQEAAAGFAVRVTSAGRAVLEHVGLDLNAVGLTGEETRGCAQLYAQSEVLADVPVPVDETATDGWEAYADQTAALRREYTLPRDAPAKTIEEPTSTLLDAPDDDYVREAAVVPEDLQSVAPRVPARVRAQVEESDPTLDDDVAAWFSPDCDRPRLSLLGPITARTHGKPISDRKPYFTELLAFLALRRRHGVTRDEICDAFGIEPGVVRNYIKIVRYWLGTNPRTGAWYLPHADKSPAAQTRGVNVYQVDRDLLVDLDLFKRLKLRGQARGGADGQRGLITALELVNGRPFSQQRESGWNWLAEGHRHDHDITMAIADAAFTVATHHLEQGQLLQARKAAELAVLAAPYEEATRLCLVRVTEAEGDHREADRILRKEVCNRSDDGGAPTELSERTKTIIGNKGWLAS